MIQSKEDYKKFISEDMKAYGLSKWNYYMKKRYPIVDYQRTLRTVEYYENCRHDILGKIALLVHQMRLHRKGIRLGFSIGRHVFDYGLRIAHYGSIVVGKHVRVGKYCVLHNGVNIGQKRGHSPIIGDRVYIAPNVCACGDITIGNNVTIGAGAIVTKSFANNVVLAGVPAKVVKSK